MSGNPVTTGRIGRKVYDLRHWKLTLLVALVIGLPLLALRFISGRNLFGGGRSTDATFFKPARQERKNWWNDLSGAARAAARCAVLVGVWLWIHAPVVLFVGLGLELVVVGLSAWRKAHERHYERMVLRPLWPAVAGIIGVPEEQPPGRWLDIPRSVLDDPTAEDAVITVGLRAADADDERRVAALVQLFDQRFEAPHYGWVDYGRRLVHIVPRPPEPTVWPAVAEILGVSPSELASQWLQVPDDPGTPGAQILVRLPHATVDDSPVQKDLKTLVNRRFVGEWSASSVCRDDGQSWAYRVVLTHQKPEPTPPTMVDFFNFQEGDA